VAAEPWLTRPPREFSPNPRSGYLKKQALRAMGSIHAEGRVNHDLSRGSAVLYFRSGAGTGTGGAGGTAGGVAGVAGWPGAGVAGWSARGVAAAAAAPAFGVLACLGAGAGGGGGRNFASSYAFQKSSADSVIFL
jgi:hypothetical protein